MENASSKLLRDAITGDWVVVAPKRGHRPNAKGKAKRPVDVFSKEHLKQEKILAVYGTGAEKITVVENKYPVFSPEQGVEGHQEIFVEGEKRGAFVDFSVARIQRVLEAYAERLRELRRVKGLKGIVIFKNEGPAAGASQVHAHSQLFGISFVPDRWKEIDARRKKTEKLHGKAAHAIALAEANPSNTIFADTHVVAFAHPAARFPFEVRILTKRKIDNLTQATAEELQSLAKALHALLPFVKAQKLSYNFFFHDVFADTHEQLEIRFVPRANVWGGFELDAGVAINPVSAEVSAQEYRLTRPKKQHRNA